MIILGRLKFETIPTIITLVALTILLSLGFWQLQRMSFKNAVIEDLHQRTIQAPMALPEAGFKVEDYIYRKVILSGRFDYSHEIFVYARDKTYNGQDGFMLFTPFITNDNRTIIVNRGWIPTKRKPQGLRLQSILPGDLTLTGVIMKSEQKYRFTPENDLKQNVWFYADIDQMRELIDSSVESFYVMQITEKQDLNSTPIVNTLDFNIFNNHLSYAMTWFSFALILICIFLLYHRIYYVKY